MPKKVDRDCDNNPFENGIHALDLKKLANYSMKTFFNNKIDFLGEKILDKDLFTEANYKMVLRTQFNDKTFNYIHNHCLSKIPRESWYKDNTVPWSVHCLLELLNELKQLLVPKELQPGLLLLYFKFCKGLSIPITSVL